MDDDLLIINAIKSSEYKQYAFERGDLDYSEIDQMGKTGSSFFFKPDEENIRNSEQKVKEDQSMETMFRSSLKGFFTGKKEDDDTTTRASSRSSYVGIPVKAVQKKWNFLYGGSGDNLEAKEIHELISEFKQSSDVLKQQMRTFSNDT